MTQPTAKTTTPKRLTYFERYLSIWVAACMIVGVLLGRVLPGTADALRRMQFGAGSQINVPIAVLIWLMIVPMMMKVDFASIRRVGQQPRGLFVTLFVNWLVKPFSMALIAWLFFRYVFKAWIPSADADQYIAGCIILAAAPCTAMVFVWSYLTEGDPAYTLVQVSVNDLIMLLLFAPIVRFLVNGASSLHVPFQVLLYAVAIFIVIPLVAGTALRAYFIHAHGRNWFEKQILPRFAPVSMLALLATLVLIFAFQADNILGKSLHVLLIAVPILIQVYFKFLTYLRIDAAPESAPRGGSTWSSDRCQQLLRACGGDSHSPVRPGIGSRIGDSRRGLDRGACDAVGMLVLQSNAALVPGDGDCGFCLADPSS